MCHVKAKAPFVQQKVQSGRANENYQKINLKKKVFVRGRAGRMTGAKYRRQEWKKKMDEKQKADTKWKNNKSKSNKKETEDNVSLVKTDINDGINSAEGNSKGMLTSKIESQGKGLKKKKIPTNDSLGENARATEQSRQIPRKAKKKNNTQETFEDDSFVTEEEIEEYRPEKKTKTVSRGKSKTTAVKKARKKITGKKKEFDLDADQTTENIQSNELDTKGDVWGDDVDESELLNCFDEKGEVKPSISNDKDNSQQPNPLNRIGTKVEPYYSSDASYDRQEVLNVLQNKFGHMEFRSGQEEAIRRILCGHSTLVQLATGSGKSLVYQLPAYLYGEREHCITLVVSPLVSLMEDQINGLPGFLRAACFHSAQTVRQREKVVEQIKFAAFNNHNKNLRFHFLLVSPETLAGGGSLFASVLRHLPPIAFVCIDEAHCVSAWSHNFRPTYLRLCRVINEKLGVTTLLGLTASAPEATIKDVADRLAVCPKDGVIRGKLLPANLKLSVSRGESRGRGKEGDLIALLASEPFIHYCSIIVYCTRRDTCEKLATIIRTHFQDRDIKLNKVSK